MDPLMREMYYIVLLQKVKMKRTEVISIKYTPIRSGVVI